MLETPILKILKNSILFYCCQVVTRLTFLGFHKIKWTCDKDRLSIPPVFLINLIKSFLLPFKAKMLKESQLVGIFRPLAVISRLHSAQHSTYCSSTRNPAERILGADNMYLHIWDKLSWCYIIVFISGNMFKEVFLSSVFVTLFPLPSSLLIKTVDDPTLNLRLMIRQY